MDEDRRRGDKDRHIGDPDFVTPPACSILLYRMLMPMVKARRASAAGETDAAVSLSSDARIFHHRVPHVIRASSSLWPVVADPYQRRSSGVIARHRLPC